MAADNVYDEDQEYLIEARDAISELEDLKDKLEEIKLLQKKNKRAIVREERATGDEISATLKKRKEQIAASYDRQIDLKNPKTNRKNAGFTDEEREKFSTLLDSGFIDTFRFFNPDAEGIYSWWSYRFKAREKNAGWRIDYFLTSKALESRLVDAKIHTEVLGSDHCPVELDIDL